MTLQPSRLRRVNQRLTLAKYKIRTSTSNTFKGLVLVLLAKPKLKKYILFTTNQQRRTFSLFYRASASEARFLNQLVIAYEILNLVQIYLILAIVISICNSITKSYSNNKY